MVEGGAVGAELEHVADDEPAVAGALPVLQQVAGGGHRGGAGVVGVVDDGPGTD